MQAIGYLVKKIGKGINDDTTKNFRMDYFKLISTVISAYTVKENRIAFIKLLAKYSKQLNCKVLENVFEKYDDCEKEHKECMTINLFMHDTRLRDLQSNVARYIVSAEEKHKLEQLLCINGKIIEDISHTIHMGWAQLDETAQYMIGFRKVIEQGGPFIGSKIYTYGIADFKVVASRNVDYLFFPTKSSKFFIVPDTQGKQYVYGAPNHVGFITELYTKNIMRPLRNIFLYCFDKNNKIIFFHYNEKQNATSITSCPLTEQFDCTTHGFLVGTKIIYAHDLVKLLAIHNNELCLFNYENKEMIFFEDNNCTVNDNIKGIISCDGKSIVIVYHDKNNEQWSSFWKITKDNTLVRIRANRSNFFTEGSQVLFGDKFFAHCIPNDGLFIRSIESNEIVTKFPISGAVHSMWWNKKDYSQLVLLFDKEIMIIDMKKLILFKNYFVGKLDILETALIKSIVLKENYEKDQTMLQNLNAIFFKGLIF